MKDCLDDCTFLFAHEKIGTGGSYPCSHGGAEDLVDVCAHEIEGTMFKNEIEDSVDYMVGCDSLWVGDAFIFP